MDTISTHYLTRIELNRDGIPDFSVYPFCIPAVRNLETLDLHPKVTFLIGENGTGKSTLLEAIAVASAFNPEGGSRNLGFATRESHSQLCDHLRLRRGTTRPRDGYFLRAESFFNVATAIEKIDSDPDHNVPGRSAGPAIVNSYGGQTLHEQSHGESFLTLLTQRFRGNGLYLLDEPEAALSPSRQMSVLSVMHDLIRRNSQFIIATHSPILMAYPDAVIYLFSNEAITAIRYTETEHFAVTRDFLNRHEIMLDILLGGDSA